MARKAKRLGNYYLTSMAEEAIRQSDPRYFRSTYKKKSLLAFLEHGGHAHFDGRKLKVVGCNLIDDVTDYQHKRGTEDEGISNKSKA